MRKSSALVYPRGLTVLEEGGPKMRPEPGTAAGVRALFLRWRKPMILTASVCRLWHSRADGLWYQGSGARRSQARRAIRWRQRAKANDRRAPPSIRNNDDGSGVTVTWAGADSVASATTVEVSGLKFGSLGSMENTL